MRGTTSDEFPFPILDSNCINLLMRRFGIFGDGVIVCEVRLFACYKNWKDAKGRWKLIARQ
ncbi:hypothetical protein V6Z11_A09G243000 [Gossypium hirsutum]